MAPLSLTLLGGFDARLDSGAPLTLPTRKSQALLAYLALMGDQTHPRDKLAALLWGNLRKEQARKSLRQALSALRKAVGSGQAGGVRVEGDTVALDLPAVEIDVRAFERCVAESTPEALGRAAALYRGDLLEGLEFREDRFDEWLLAERERLRELAIETLARLLAHQRTTGAMEAATQTALRLLALDPLQEAVHRALMRLYVEQGRRGAALRHYQHCVGVLQRELGVEPEAGTKELYQEILRQRPSRMLAPDLPIESRPRPVETRTVVATQPDISGTETPLIGRELELARLATALGEAWAGRGQILTLIGESGVGKSRLLAAVGVDAVRRDGRVLLGRCYELEQILPFGPWVDAFRSALVTRDAEVLRDLPPVWRSELSRLLPEVETPPGGTGDYLHLFESVAQLLKQLADRQPLVLMLEDLHWADEMSLRLLTFLARRLETQRVLVVGTAREEDLADSPTLRRTLEDLAREGHLVRLTLGSLSRADTGTLVRALAQSGSEEAALAQLGELVWRVSEGNPFMVVENMLALREGMTRETAAGLSLPQRVRQVIARRLERLGERGRQLVPAAAVIGRAFDFALLQRVAGLPEKEAAEGLEELVRRRVLHGVGERFDFTHEAIHAVATSQLLSPRRRLLHRAVGEALEALYAADLGPHYVALGVHHREGEVWDKALAYFRQAGAQAVARSAHREAAACYDEALAALAHLPETRHTREQAIDLRTDVHNALIALGQPDRAGERLREAETLAKSLNDQARLGRVAAYMTNFFWLIGDFGLAAESGERARGIAEALEDAVLRFVANFYLGQVHHFRGNYREAIALLRLSVDFLDTGRLTDRAGLPGLPSVIARAWLAWSLSERGEFTEGIGRGTEALALAETVDHAFSRADAYRGLGCLYLRQGDLRQAIDVLERGLALCWDRDLTLWFPSFGSALGYAYALDGRAEEGTALLERAVERASSLGIKAGHALRTAWLSEAYLLGGQVNEAVNLARQALDLSREREERGNEGWTLRLLAELAAHHDPVEAKTAQDYFREAMALASELEMRPLLAHCHLGLGALYRRVAHPEQARAELLEAIDMFRSMEMVFWLARAEAELAGAG